MVTQLPLSLGAPSSRAVVLGSGSAGNALVVERAATG